MAIRAIANVEVDLEFLIRFKEQINAQLNGSPGPVQDAIKKWAIRARGYLQERFDSFSKGGGDWPALDESTLRRRRGTTASILRDLGLLFAVLNPVFSGAPGALQEEIPFGIRIGFGGPGGHENSAATVSEIASFHQVGAGVLPVREIIVTPIQSVVQLMADDMDEGLQGLSQG